jgi:flavin reductase (DIM6/NTAB) family NADH-FMN oxidoreductase RutF
MAHNDKTQEYKECMSRWASGVALVTTVDTHGQPQGLLISSLGSVSLNPILLSFALSQQSALYNVFCQTSHFAVNILANAQQPLAQNFMGKGTRWQNLIEGTDWHKGSTTACPILPQSLAVLECTVQQRLPLGDHDMFIGHVLTATPQSTDNTQALLYFARGFTTVI